MNYYYYININERGEFNSDIRDSNDSTIYEITSVDHLNQLVEDGFMSHCHDVSSLKTYLINMSILPVDCKVYRGNEQRLYY